MRETQCYSGQWHDHATPPFLSIAKAGITKRKPNFDKIFLFLTRLELESSICHEKVNYSGSQHSMTTGCSMRATLLDAQTNNIVYVSIVVDRLIAFGHFSLLTVHFWMDALDTTSKRSDRIREWVSRCSVTYGKVGRRKQGHWHRPRARALSLARLCFHSCYSCLSHHEQWT